MGYEEKQKLDGRCEGKLDAAARASRGRRADDQNVSAPAAGRDGLGTPERRFERFEPITVRAAARVLQLQRAGVVSASEARFYLRELTAMDAHAGTGASRCLARAAQRHLSARPVARSKRARHRAQAVELRALAVIIHRNPASWRMNEGLTPGAGVRLEW